MPHNTSATQKPGSPTTSPALSRFPRLARPDRYTTMFKIMARSLLELGSELISSDIIAFYELIKNGFDAGTKTGVEIHFQIVLGLRRYRELIRSVQTTDTPWDVVSRRAYDALNTNVTPAYDEACKYLDTAVDIHTLRTALDKVYSLNTLTVSDTGCGMSRHDLESVFLVIGTPSRKTAIDAALAQKTRHPPYFGEKGIGRLSAMRLGHRLTVKTAQVADQYLNCINIDWSDFDNLHAMLDDIQVAPSRAGPKPDPNWSGTTIVVHALASDWTRTRLDLMARDSFSLLSAPLQTQRQRKRIALYWNAERVAIPALDPNLLSHAHARVSGNYTTSDHGPRLSCKIDIIDLGFPHPAEHETHDLDQDELVSALIGNESGIDIGALDTVGPFSFQIHWFNRRTLSRIDGIGDRTAVRNLLAQWTGIRLYRDGFRVYPYGADADDWLGLDRRAMMSKGYTLNKLQFIGEVHIGRMSNPKLIDQTNREGLRESPEHHVMLEALRLTIQHHLRQAMRNVEAQYKQTRVKLETSTTDIQKLQRRAQNAINSLLRTVSEEERPTINDLQLTLREFVNFAARARARLADVEADARKMVDMAGVGLLVEVVAHELARVSENALHNLNSLNRNTVPADIRGRLDSLRASMKSINKRLRILDPLSVSGRQRSETFDLIELLRDTFDAHQAQFERHGIQLHLALPDGPFRIRVVKGLVVQVVENLLSNSVYWMGLERLKYTRFQPRIEIFVELHPPTLYIEDSGPGVSPQYASRIFDLFFSLKEKTQRRGMGLYIARECAGHNGGSLTIDAGRPNANGKFSRFVYVISNDEGTS